MASGYIILYLECTRIKLVFVQVSAVWRTCVLHIEPFVRGLLQRSSFTLLGLSWASLSAFEGWGHFLFLPGPKAALMMK